MYLFPLPYFIEAIASNYVVEWQEIEINQIVESEVEVLQLIGLTERWTYV